MLTLRRSATWKTSNRRDGLHMPHEASNCQFVLFSACWKQVRKYMHDGIAADLV